LVEAELDNQIRKVTIVPRQSNLHKEDHILVDGCVRNKVFSRRTRPRKRKVARKLSPNHKMHRRRCGTCADSFIVPWTASSGGTDQWTAKMAKRFRMSHMKTQDDMARKNYCTRMSYVTWRTTYNLVLLDICSRVIRNATF
jgi:hypothetical protein